ncbi:MAG: class I SAM-dependent methyltransferase [Acidobacteriota bacterium]
MTENVANKSSFDPAKYRHWYQTPLGIKVNHDEKEVVFSSANLTQREVVLDLGCGEGNFTEEIALRSKLVVGLDLSMEMLQAARARLHHHENIAWVQAQGEYLPFEDASFDVVVAITVLSFIQDKLTVVTGLTHKDKSQVSKGFLGQGMLENLVLKAETR